MSDKYFVHTRGGAKISLGNRYEGYGGPYESRSRMQIIHDAAKYAEGIELYPDLRGDGEHIFIPFESIDYFSHEK